MSKDINKIDAERLEISDDQAYFLDGAPFNGVAVHYREDGSTESEVEFRDGIQNGVSRDWDAKGQLIFEGVLRSGAYHGTCRTWTSAGRLVQEDTYEHGIRTSRKKWSAEGELTEEAELEPGNPNYELLQTARRAFAFENEYE
jgi:antitoxin component YwqK of YwqJK toxin-antitoxin module